MLYGPADCSVEMVRPASSRHLFHAPVPFQPPVGPSRLTRLALPRARSPTRSTTSRTAARSSRRPESPPSPWTPSTWAPSSPCTADSSRSSSTAARTQRLLPRQAIHALRRQARRGAPRGQGDQRRAEKRLRRGARQDGVALQGGRADRLDHHHHRFDRRRAGFAGPSVGVALVGDNAVDSFKRLVQTEIVPALGDCVWCADSTDSAKCPDPVLGEGKLRVACVTPRWPS